MMVVIGLFENATSNTQVLNTSLSINMAEYDKKTQKERE